MDPNPTADDEIFQWLQLPDSDGEVMEDIVNTSNDLANQQVLASPQDSEQDVGLLDTSISLIGQNTSPVEIDVYMRRLNNENNCGQEAMPIEPASIMAFTPPAHMAVAMQNEILTMSSAPFSPMEIGSGSGRIIHRTDSTRMTEPFCNMTMDGHHWRGPETSTVNVPVGQRINKTTYAVPGTGTFICEKLTQKPQPTTQRYAFVQEIPQQPNATAGNKRKRKSEPSRQNIRPTDNGGKCLQYSFQGYNPLVPESSRRTEEDIANRKLIASISPCLACRIDREPCSGGDICERCQRIFEHRRNLQTHKRLRTAQVPLWRTVCQRVNPLGILREHGVVFFLAGLADGLEVLWAIDSTMDSPQCKALLYYRLLIFSIVLESWGPRILTSLLRPEGAYQRWRRILTGRLNMHTVEPRNGQIRKKEGVTYLWNEIARPSVMYTNLQRIWGPDEIDEPTRRDIILRILDGFQEPDVKDRANHESRRLEVDINYTIRTLEVSIALFALICSEIDILTKQRQNKPFLNMKRRADLCEAIIELRMIFHRFDIVHSIRSEGLSRGYKIRTPMTTPAFKKSVEMSNFILGVLDCFEDLIQERLGGIVTYKQPGIPGVSEYCCGEKCRIVNYSKTPAYAYSAKGINTHTI